jgi:hypothetical protein
MLDISLTIEGNKVIIEGLSKLAPELQPAMMRGLSRAAVSIYRQAFQWLSGAGAHREIKTSKKTGKQYSKKIMDTAAGGYPVPTRTGWLRRMLNWLKPGESKTGDVGTFTAGPNEVVIYDSAAYARAIHDPKPGESSYKFGPRRFLIDAFEMFNRGMGVQMAINDEIQKAKTKAGL